MLTAKNFFTAFKDALFWVSSLQPRLVICNNPVKHNHSFFCQLREIFQGVVSCLLTYNVETFGKLKQSYISSMARPSELPNLVRIISSIRRSVSMCAISSKVTNVEEFGAKVFSFSENSSTHFLNSFPQLSYCVDKTSSFGFYFDKLLVGWWFRFCSFLPPLQNHSYSDKAKQQ